jgi:hypothetical protein
LKVIHHILVSSAETAGAFNMGVDTVKSTCTAQATFESGSTHFSFKPLLDASRRHRPATHDREHVFHRQVVPQDGIQSKIV